LGIGIGGPDEADEEDEVDAEAQNAAGSAPTTETPVG
jgi:hypothetical protein